MGLNKFCHISKILSHSLILSHFKNGLKIYNLEQLYLSHKLSFIRSLEFNSLALAIFDKLIADKNENHIKTKSFIKDILLIEKSFNMEIVEIKNQTRNLNLLLRNSFNQRDGLTDSIDWCLENHQNKHYKNVGKSYPHGLHKHFKPIQLWLIKDECIFFFLKIN